MTRIRAADQLQIAPQPSHAYRTDMAGPGFFLRFTALYALLLAAGLALGYVVRRAAGFDIGYVVNLLCFVAALVLAASPPQRRLLPVLFPGPAGAVPRHRMDWHFCLSCGLLATAVDCLYYAAASALFAGDLQFPSPWRIVAITAVYAVLIYVLRDTMPKPASSSQDCAQGFGPSLVVDFKGLSAADKSVLVAGVRHPGSPVLTTRGSANDLFWSRLSEVAWAERMDLPEGIADSPLAERFAAWSVTPLGAASLPVLFRKASE